VGLPSVPYWEAATRKPKRLVRPALVVRPVQAQEDPGQLTGIPVVELLDEGMSLRAEQWLRASIVIRLSALMLVLKLSSVGARGEGIAGC
jgi:hypothetical protein